MAESNLTIANVMAGFLAAAVEGKNIYDTYRAVGIEKEDLELESPFVAYAKTLVDDEVLKNISGTKLFLVKRVWCKTDIKEMENAINSRDNKKYGVVVVVSADKESIWYTKETPGIQTFLVRAKDKKEALNKSATMSPIFGMSHDLFDVKSAKEIDTAIEDAVSTHTPASIQKFVDIFKKVFSVNRLS